MEGLTPRPPPFLRQATVALQPAEFASWSDARSEVRAQSRPLRPLFLGPFFCSHAPPRVLYAAHGRGQEARFPRRPPRAPAAPRSLLPSQRVPPPSPRPLKAQLQAELSQTTSESEQEEIRAAFASREKALEHDIDHKPMECNIELQIAYNFLSS